ncbi:Interleukin-32 [Saguinus oedipus]|uniref:Interleukin-32 n=1 Tax=Saguinus oedipus TaxID=9490 RepID=A0ABQ9UK20_SAGOE|nr:Interleukin-32 [Saguinus oedipus]
MTLNGAPIPQELTPLLEKGRDELRCRGNRPPALEVEDPETEEPEETKEGFQAMLQRLQTWRQMVLS